MKLQLFTLLFGLFLCASAGAQNTINDYHYIQVPDQFEFLKGKDQYQVNSLVRFLFKKHGFNAYIGDELPLYLRKQPCKGLYADVQSRENFVYTRITIYIKDCKGSILFTSQEGRSKDKDYRKAYHGAVREAFESIAALNMNQLALAESDFTNIEAQANKTEALTSGAEMQTDKQKDTLQTTVVFNSEFGQSQGEEGKAPKEDETSEVTTSMVKVQTLVYKEYELLKDGDAYRVFYQGKPIGIATPTDQQGKFDVRTSQFIGQGYETSGSFRLERNIEGLDQTITMLFKEKM